jgi:predicted HAD superfamily Cof-like phosphohydrolase
MTNFKDVSAFNELIGNAQGDARIDAKKLRKQYDLIQSEMQELDLAIVDFELASKVLDGWPEGVSDQADIDDFEEAKNQIRDGIADVLVTTYGLAHRMGIDADKDMKAVSESNMSKFFEGTEAQAMSVEHALTQSLGIKVERRYSGDVSLEPLDKGRSVGHMDVSVWAFVSADDSDPERPRGKLLKAPGYKPPVFD